MQISNAGILKTLGWGFYLACSWTWCIGMFLPILLVKDFGPLAFIAFAAPNIIGAASVGWVLSRHTADTILHRHDHAVRAFAAITVAFQSFFFVYLAKQGLVTWWSAAPAGVVFILMAAAPAWKIGEGLIATIIILGSLAVLGVELGSGTLAHDLPPPTGQPIDLLFLAPVCVFGFLLCPYLDPTFLKARFVLDRTRARFAFTFGFFGPFALMITGTLLYAGWWFGGSANTERPWYNTLGPFIVAFHIMPHLAFVISAQSRQAAQVGREPQPALLCLYAFFAGLLFAAIPAHLKVFELSAFEFIYRGFMAFYGLGFPAYVWLCVFPTRDGHTGPRPDKLVVLTIALMLGLPCFALAFIDKQTAWLGPGLAVVLLARLALPQGKRMIYTPRAAE